MFLRSAILACAAAMAASTLAPAFADTHAASSARCEEMNFRVYFNHRSAALNPLAMQVLDLAEAQVAGCSYAELHVLVDAGAPYARARGDAILAAADARAWNVARVERRTVMRRASLSNGPDYAEVVMTPRVMPVGAPVTADSDVGV